ncbi:protein kinase shaggy-like [Octopus sinensis]|uniref:Protein kinase shaggy-like n=1 Tax=Octopus sinensis TaxID=2607531 RepID=A0A6P7TVT0_9MOLL|nr:protein kinase shaggy-like [Octopus sinensis]
MNFQKMNNLGNLLNNIPENGNTTVKVNGGYNDSESEYISIRDLTLIGSGNFGHVFRAKIIPRDTVVAIKRVIQRHKYKVLLKVISQNRELQIMRQLQHINIVTLIYYFYSVDSEFKVCEFFYVQG